MAKGKSFHIEGFNNILEALVLWVETEATPEEAIESLALWDQYRKRIDRIQADNKNYRSEEDSGKHTNWRPPTGLGWASITTTVKAE